MEGLLVSTRSKMALLALLANCSVEKVSAEADTEGLMQMINLILPWPSRESLRMRVSLEFLKGICVRDLSMSAEMQWPRQERLPLILVNSWIRISFYRAVRSDGILNFSEPAKSTMRNWMRQSLQRRWWFRLPSASPCRFGRWSAIGNS